MKLALIFALVGFSSFAGESVEAYLAAVTNVAPEKCLCRFLDYPPSKGKLGFPRCLFENPLPLNPDFYLKEIDFTCVSPWNDTYGTERAGTAISRRHIVCAKHFPLTKGTRIAFVGKFGDVSHYTIKATKEFSNCDIMIGLLDYELTPDIQPARILPENYTNCIPVGTRLPLVTFNKREQATMGEVEFSLEAISKPLDDNRSARDSRAQCRTGRARESRALRVFEIDSLNKKGQSRLAPRPLAREEWKPYRTHAVKGDSGNPAFALYNHEPILLYCLFSGGRGSGPRLHEHRREIQQTMDDLSPGYKLQSFDFEPVNRSN